MIEIEIVYEDKQLLVVNKPAGLVVNRSETVKGDTLQDWLVECLGLTGDEGELMTARSGFAHRLDKETSGCLLVGKNEEVLVELMGQFKKRETKKKYLALVHGKMEPKEGGMSLPIARDVKNREKRAVGYEGKKAETWWKVKDYYRDSEGEIYSLVEVRPKTGRTHQIRVHLSHLGHPIFGDSMYLTKKKKLKDREALARHFLHAHTLQFVNPVTKKTIKVKADLSGDLKKVLSGLDKNPF